MSINNINQAVILAGGVGKRLRPITNNVPKPMAIINRYPFLDYLIKSINDLGIKKILILTGYKSKKIIDRYKKMNYLDISFSRGKINHLSGTRLLNAYDKLEDHFLLMYGDNYWPIDFNKMIKSFNKRKSLISLTAYANKDGKGEYGYNNNVKVNNLGIVNSYDNFNKNLYMNCVNIGYFIINKIILNKSLKKNISFEEDIMKKYIHKRKVSAFVTNRQYKFITNSDSLLECKKYFLKNNIFPLSRKYLR